MIKHNEYLLVEVPQGTKDVFIDEGDPNIVFLCDVFGEYFGDSVSLPPGTYQLIGLAAELTEEQWREIVEVEKYFKIKWQSCYKNYDVQMGFGFSVIKTATASGQSLLRSHNLKPETTVIIQTLTP